MPMSRLIFTSFKESVVNGIVTFTIRANIDGEELGYKSLPFKESKLTEKTILEVAKLGFETLYHNAKLVVGIPTTGVIDMGVFTHKHFRDDCEELDVPFGLFKPTNK